MAIPLPTQGLLFTSMQLSLLIHSLNPHVLNLELSTGGRLLDKQFY